MNRAKRNPRLYLDDILSSIARIEEYTSKGREDFFANLLVQDGVIRQLSIIGEAAVKVPTGMKTKQPEIPWNKIIGMRNIIIHDYSDTDIYTVWDTVCQDLPPLKRIVGTMRREKAA